MHNTVDFFRYGDKYYDVFIEEDHYLYVEAEPWNWAHLVTCIPYKKIKNLSGTEEWLMYEYSGASTEYLETLKPAPENIAKWIIGNEIKKTAYYNSLSDPDEYNEFEDLSQIEAFEMMENC